MIKILAVIAILIATSFGATITKFSTNRIVNGDETTIENFPYQVSIQQNESHYCSGSILTPKHVLTAAHCLQFFKPEHVTVVTGRTKLNESSIGKRYPVDSWVIHPEWDHMKIINDIGVITISGEFEYGNTVQPITLAPDNFCAEGGAETVFTGWGITENGTISNVLRVIEQVVTDLDECADLFTGMTIDKKVVCAHVTEGVKGPCSSDSGGPLVSDGQQIGILSFGSTNCGTWPTVFTNVGTARDFIRKHSGI